ncbi:MAG: CPBP family intramembrane metalloprotease [Crocinitomicaceae bacterium]|nr:CPBP family intramembrane metalloprotease [Crocinitomicaceae bacterium]
MIQRIKSLPPFGQLMALLLVGGVSFFILSTILTLVITSVFPDIPITDTIYLRNAHPVLFMLLTIIPLQIGFLFVPGYLYQQVTHEANWPIRTIKNKPTKITLSIALFVSTFILLPFLTKINEIPLKYFDWYDHLIEIQNEQITMISHFIQYDVYSFITGIILISILTGIAEEYFFRGFIFRQMIDNKINVFISWGLSGFVFALLHFNYVQFLPLLLFGIVLAIIYTLVGKLWLSILLHSANNFIQLIWIRMDYSPKWMEEVNYITTIPSMLLLTGLIIYLYRMLKKTS